MAVVRSEAPTRSPLDVRGAATLACALVALGPAIIHFSVVGEHWKEWWGYGLFFGVAAWLQLSWAAVVLWRPSRGTLLLGAAGNLAVAGLWLLAVTQGVPLGPASGEAEEAAFIDSLASAFELALAGGATVIALSRLESRRPRPSLAAVLLLVCAVAVVGLTTASLARGGAEGEAEEHAATESGDRHALADGRAIREVNPQADSSYP